jgi:hypothetical protein
MPGTSGFSAFAEWHSRWRTGRQKARLEHQTSQSVIKFTALPKSSFGRFSKMLVLHIFGTHPANAQGRWRNPIHGKANKKGQGFLFSKPLPAEDALAFFRRLEQWLV